MRYYYHYHYYHYYYHHSYHYCVLHFRFVGACIDPGQTFLITEYCPRGSLQVEPRLKEAGIVFKVNPLERNSFA